MASGKLKRGALIVGWFASLLILNIASHWSQNLDKSAFVIFLEALGRLTTPLEIVSSAAIVYGILSLGARQKENDREARAAKRKTALHTAYILVGTSVAIVVIGFAAASWRRSGYVNGQQPSVNALDTTDSGVLYIDDIDPSASIAADQFESAFVQERTCNGLSLVRWSKIKNNYDATNRLFHQTPYWELYVHTLPNPSDPGSDYVVTIDPPIGSGGASIYPGALTVRDAVKRTCFVVTGKGGHSGLP